MLGSSAENFECLRITVVKILTIPGSPYFFTSFRIPFSVRNVEPWFHGFKAKDALCLRVPFPITARQGEERL